MGEAAYISSCQHTKKKTWKENYVAWIALEAWLNACPCMFLTRVFQIGVGGIPLGGGDGNFAWRIRFTWWWKPEKWFWPFEPFSRPKTTFCKYWTFIKIKIGLTCVYNEYEVKIKKVKVQWLQPKIKFLVCYNINFWLVGGDSSHPTSRESLTNMFEV